MENHVSLESVRAVGSAETADQAITPQIEKFSAAELSSLRNELLRTQLDSWQAADIAANFLAGHGYGASVDQLRALIADTELSRCSIDCLQASLERVAYIQ